MDVWNLLFVVADKRPCPSQCTLPCQREALKASLAISDAQVTLRTSSIGHCYLCKSWHKRLAIPAFNRWHKGAMRRIFSSTVKQWQRLLKQDGLRTKHMTLYDRKSLNRPLSTTTSVSSTHTRYKEVGSFRLLSSFHRSKKPLHYR